MTKKAGIGAKSCETYRKYGVSDATSAEVGFL
jgi:hypothetical protein